MRTASAWSTLGWLNDPLLSKVLNYSTGRLAELIFHELTHDEIFIKDSIDFNENIASFFGQEFTKMFFVSNDSLYNIQYKLYLNQLKDRDQLKQFVHNYIPKFERLYHEIQDYSTTEKENQKYFMIEEFKKELSQQNFQDYKYTDFISKNDEFNNAHLLSFERYSGSQQKLEKELKVKFNGDILKMLDFYKKNFNSL
jgi:predicted aminopeptidase